MLDRCPTCGKTIGTLMESHPDKPGVMEILSGGAGEISRVLLTVALCVLAVLIVVGAESFIR